jgi:ribosomal protein S18 acetylase RimI-like enzyme
MQLRDLPAVFDLGLHLFTAERFPTLYRCWDEDELVQLFGSDVETCLVAEEAGRLVGFALGHLMDKPRSAWRYGWLMWLGVARGYKRRGVASRLVNQLTRLFIERGARIMLVDTDESNAGALAFFRRQGFGREIRHVFLSLNLENHPKYIEQHEAVTEGWED